MSGLPKRRSRRSSSKELGPERAVIDIGSNTVRMVIYGGPRRAPAVWLNEKVTAKLGRDLAATGRIPDKAIDLAQRGLARFAAILEDIGIDDIQCVATSAVRDAENGGDVVKLAGKLGFDVQVLSGEEEAITSAYGVIGAIPGAQGVVADLGGGSLELVAIDQGEASQGVSLPLGTLRLPALREKGDGTFVKAVSGELEQAGWAAAHPGPLYMVGGTWRAMAKFAMHDEDYPLTDPHAYCLGPEDADRIAKKLAQSDPDTLRAISGISSSRAAGLPNAAAMLRIVLEKLQPDGLIFASWGLREGLLYRQLSAGERKLDPLLTAVAQFTDPRGSSLTRATQIAAWTAATAGAITNGESSSNGNERLRLAATMMAMAAARLEPNMRLDHCFDWAMHKRWLGLDHAGRAMLGAALRGACGKPEPTDGLRRLTGEKALREAAGWGLAIRLCRRIGAGSRLSLLTSKLRREEDTLVLWVDPSRAQLVSDGVTSDLKNLANWLELDHRLELN